VFSGEFDVLAVGQAIVASRPKAQAARQIENAAFAEPTKIRRSHSALAARQDSFAVSGNVRISNAVTLSTGMPPSAVRSPPGIVQHHPDVQPGI